MRTMHFRAMFSDFRALAMLTLRSSIPVDGLRGFCAAGWPVRAQHVSSATATCSRSPQAPAHQKCVSLSRTGCVSISMLNCGQASKSPSTFQSGPPVADQRRNPSSDDACQTLVLPPAIEPVEEAFSPFRNERFLRTMAPAGRSSCAITFLHRCM